MNPPLSLPADNVKFGSCTMESDKFITVCETAQQQVAIIDMAAGNTVTRQKMSAEAAIMNPLSKVIALRGKLICYDVVNAFVCYYVDRGVYGNSCY